MGSVLGLWHEFREKGISIPPESLLKEESNHTVINNVIIDENEGTVLLSDPHMSLDVGGNVRAIGEKGDAKPWTAGVENPDKKGSEPYIAQVNLSNGAIATSGNY